MEVEFYFDPSCPFCWITSRWLLLVSGERDIHIEWRPFSLALKNNELISRSDESPYAEGHRASHRVLRVMMAARQHDASLIDLYTTSGINHHVAGFEFDEDHIADMLQQNNLPAEIAQAADDTTYDSELQAHIQAATDIAGSDIGVPTIIFKNETGQKQGFFGPVLQKLPDKDEALALWDGLSKLASNSSFYELKRSRPGGGPDTASTAKC